MNDMQSINALNAIANHLGRLQTNQSAQISSLIQSLSDISKYLKEIEHQLRQIVEKKIK